MRIDHQRIHLHVKPNTSKTKRAELLYEWQKSLLHGHIQEVIAKWDCVMEVKVNAYFVQKMK